MSYIQVTSVTCMYDNFKVCWLVHPLTAESNLYKCSDLWTVAKFSSSSWFMLWSGSRTTGSLMLSNSRLPWPRATSKSSCTKSSTYTSNTRARCASSYRRNSVCNSWWCHLHLVLLVSVCAQQGGYGLDFAGEFSFSELFPDWLQGLCCFLHHQCKSFNSLTQTKIRALTFTVIKDYIVGRVSVTNANHVACACLQCGVRSTCRGSTPASPPDPVSAACDRCRNVAPLWSSAWSPEIIPHVTA